MIETPFSTPNQEQYSLRRRLVQVGTWLTIASAALSLVPTAAAHEGTTHAGTPHWILLVVIVLGIGIVGSSIVLSRGRWKHDSRRAVAGILTGLVIAMVGTIGIVQIQIEPVNTAPVGRSWYPVLSLVAGGLILGGSVILGRLRWPHRPAYTVLGLLFGLWVSYPVLVPRSALTHPAGYLLVLGLPLVVGYVIWRDVWPAVVSSLEKRLARIAGTVVTSLFVVFFLFSAGLFSVNPDTGKNVPESAFITVARFSDPLVVWPAIEFYLPSVPLVGALSVGTAILILVLAGLIGTNAVLATEVWTRRIRLNQSGGAFGAVATTGATACCCCGPAAYAITSALLGVSASPLYWAFVSPSSPLGALFLVGAVALMTRSAVELAGTLANEGVCKIA